MADKTHYQHWRADGRLSCKVDLLADALHDLFGQALICEQGLIVIHQSPLGVSHHRHRVVQTRTSETLQRMTIARHNVNDSEHAQGAPDDSFVPRLHVERNALRQREMAILPGKIQQEMDEAHVMKWMALLFCELRALRRRARSRAC